MKVLDRAHGDKEFFNYWFDSYIAAMEWRTGVKLSEKEKAQLYDLIMTCRNGGNNK